MMKRRKLSTKSDSSKSTISPSPEPVPPDVIFDILTRLPVKSLMRFKCVDKLCLSIITDPCFAREHKRRQSHPKRGLLITSPTKLQLGQTFFFAESTGGKASHRVTVPPRFSRYTTQSVNGLVCLDFGLSAIVCNPSTGQALTLPVIWPTDSPEASSTYFCVNSFGFDPKADQYKVLNTWKIFPNAKTEYRVFTLGTSAGGSGGSWRLITSDGPPYYPQRESVCIDGIVYFRNWVGISGSHAVILAFDVGEESFKVIKLPPGSPNYSSAETSRMINLSGKLAIADSRIDQRNKLCLWTLEDSAKDLWAKKEIAFRSYWKNTGRDQKYLVAGKIDTGEILLAPQRLSKPFYVYYCNMETSRLRRVSVSKLPEVDAMDVLCNAVTVTNYEENIFPL